MLHLPFQSLSRGRKTILPTESLARELARAAQVQAAEGVVHPIEGAHHTADTRVNRRQERRGVEFTPSALVNVGGIGLTIALVIVEDEVLDAGREIVRLNPFHKRRHQLRGDWAQRDTAGRGLWSRTQP